MKNSKIDLNENELDRERRLQIVENRRNERDCSEIKLRKEEKTYLSDGVISAEIADLSSEIRIEMKRRERNWVLHGLGRGLF